MSPELFIPIAHAAGNAFFEASEASIAEPAENMTRQINPLGDKCKLANVRQELKELLGV